jgi:hypothetical protein
LTDAKTLFPMFVFERRSHVEREVGYILAGQLIVDIPNAKTLKRRHQRLVEEIIDQLIAEAQSGRMAEDAMVFGWHGRAHPSNEVDVTNDTIMSAWAKRSLVIAVRVGPRPSDGYLRIDSDQLRQMGLLKNH